MSSMHVHMAFLFGKNCPKISCALIFLQAFANLGIVIKSVLQIEIAEENTYIPIGSRMHLLHRCRRRLRYPEVQESHPHRHQASLHRWWQIDWAWKRA
jgi:hypothetical protein